jgi:hypothetical protein
MKDDPKEIFLDKMNEVFRVGLAVFDAMHKTNRGIRSTARVDADNLDWILETTENPRRIITITLVE